MYRQVRWNLDSIHQIFIVSNALVAKHDLEVSNFISEKEFVLVLQYKNTLMYI